MSCDCTTVQKSIPFTGGCWHHDDRKCGLALLVFVIIITPVIMHYSSISLDEFAEEKRKIATMGCLDLRHYLATDPPSGETDYAETNFKWKCLEAGKIDLTIDEED